MKCINGEKATYNTRVFSSKRERTYQILLEDAGAAQAETEEERSRKRTRS